MLLDFVLDSWTASCSYPCPLLSLLGAIYLVDMLDKLCQVQ
jgi:hypothetical protein